ncbi:MAG TPA: tetratricopeptide repeat protein [Thermoanaerobaculia bacterium]|nr:tetratricopeptide repeat protein [Thermoanaerobaculia bacterium]
MNKDNALFATIGVLLGFLAGYLLQEVMVLRQPARLLPGQAAVAVQGAPGPGGPGPGATPAGPGGPAGSSGGAPMAQIQQLLDRIKANPEDADAVLQLASLNLEIRNWARARDLYRRYLELRPADPNLPDVLLDMAVAQRALGELEPALATLQQARQISPQHWQSLFNIVVVLVDLQRFGEAEEALAELKRLQPDNERVNALATAVAERAAAS